MPGEGHKRILIVDDDAGTRLALAEILRDEHYDVAVAPDGVVALELVSGFAPDLVLSDMEMPNLDGAELLQAMRRAHFEAPTILMTAHALRRRDVLEALGATDLLLKPLDAADVLKSIARALHRETSSSRPPH
jgi:CheY-like chemotaxis protein